MAMGSGRGDTFPCISGLVELYFYFYFLFFKIQPFNDIIMHIIVVFLALTRTT